MRSGADIRLTKGRAGEGVAADYLRDRGYRVIESNYRCRLGEIDIVVVKGDEVVFVEVKTWDHYGVQSLEWAIDGHKQRRIIGGTRHFLMGHSEYAAFGVRYDVIFVSGHLAQIEHIEAAFED